MVLDHKMTQAEIHLLTNHLPLILPMIGALILIISIVINSEASKRIGYFIVFLGGLLTLPAFLSGEGAEHIVEELGRSHKLIHEHEETAEIYAYLSYVVGLTALLGLYMNWKKKSLEKIILPIVLIGTLALAYLSYETGNSGGKISHPELIKEKD